MTTEFGLIDDEVPLKSWNCNSLPIDESEDDNSGGFECNICLDSVQDPVVTLCGHLYCWPCIYKWISHSSENTDHQEPRCPVCKARVSEETLVPLYGRGGSTKSYDEKASKLDTVVPKRPRSPRCVASPIAASNLYPSQPIYHHNYPQHHQQSHLYPNGYMASPMLSLGGAGTNFTHPAVGMFGEMVYARIFGNSETSFLTYPNSYSLAGTATPRVRRHTMEVDRLLSKLCFFLFCCMVLCLLLF
ncbi:ubiquitin-protein ligase [Lithospermum erythrorhizon]|uniref:E3 ubiquitin-protein ligase RMA n=1 Tax=Lithospermum erythrorhizon TaxID=34254 RepID=A0AAV3RSJ0_LITER